MKAWPPAQARPPDQKRYGWHRAYNGDLYDPTWRSLARRLNLPLGTVWFIVCALRDTANQGRPRGSVANFSIENCATALDVDDETVARVFNALELTGWIDQDHIVSWDDKQPDNEDPTNAARQQRFRDRRKAEREDAKRKAFGLSTVQHNAVTADRAGDAPTACSTAAAPADANALTSEPNDEATLDFSTARNAVIAVTVTTRLRPDADSGDLFGDAARAEKPQGLADEGASASAADKPASWLIGKGAEILVRRLSLHPQAAQLKIKRWRQAIDDDAVLVGILAAADDRGLTGESMQRQVEAAIDHHKRLREQGHPLPLPPMLATSGSTPAKPAAQPRQGDAHAENPDETSEGAASGQGARAAAAARFSGKAG